MNLTVLCHVPLFSHYTVEVKEEEDLLYHGKGRPFEMTLDDVFEEWGGFPNAFLLRSTKEKKNLILEKHFSPGFRISFTFRQGDVNYRLQLGKDKSTKDFVVFGPQGQLSLRGKVRDLSFSLFDQNLCVGTIQGKRVEGGKLYDIQGEDETLLLGTTLALDNLYRHY